MLAPPRASEEYEAAKRLTAATMLAVRSQWDRGMAGDWLASWSQVGPRVAALVAAGQLGAARSGVQYVGDVLEEQGEAAEPVAEPNPRALAGVASDGRDLTGLLALSVPKARDAGSLAAGRAWLDLVVETQLADAHRSGIQLGTVARPGTGWVRMVNTPCCKRCAVQAGKFFRANDGFLRHPRCRCFHLPTTDPASRYATYPDPSQISDLSEGERKALEAGGDYSQVLNASRGASRNGMTTTEGTTRRGVAYRALNPDGAGDAKRGRYRATTKRRLTPDGIYRIASDEDEARRLLKANGYLL